MPNDQSPVLVPLDGSKNAENALPLAVFLANADSAPLHLVHVADDREGGGTLDLEKAAEIFRGYAADLMKHHTVEAGFTAKLLAGNPARLILEAASAGPGRSEARAIVIATHGLGGLKSTLIGSVADKVIRAATVPTLVVPGIGPAAQPSNKPVVVGVDGSELAEAGLEHARALAARLKAQVIIVRACQVPVSTGYQFAYYYPPNLLDELEQAARDYVEKVALPGELTVVMTGTPVIGLREVAERHDASAIVVTSHGRGFVSRLALGSTTAALTHDLERPLLVIPVGK